MTNLLLNNSSHTLRLDAFVAQGGAAIETRLKSKYHRVFFLLLLIEHLHQQQSQSTNPVTNNRERPNCD